MSAKSHNHTFFSPILALLALIILAASDGQAAPIISEASSANLRVLHDMDDDAEDWIEIYNPDPTDVDLKGYRLSDDFADPEKWEFPDLILPAGEYLIVFASGKNRVEPELHCNFKLKSSGETLRLFDDFGVLLSELEMGPVTVDVSVGFQGAALRYFAEATPGSANTSTGYLGLTPEPEMEPERGFYSASVQVEIEAGEDDQLFWSDDGSIPTAVRDEGSQEVTLNQTTTLRARAVRDGYLPSRIVTHSYVIDEEINLPVVCLTMDPPDLWDPSTGIYVLGDSADANWPFYGANFWEDWEKQAHWEFFEPGGGGFHLDGGAKIHGGWSRAQPQKAIRLIARDAYGESELQYPLYPENDFSTYKRLILRNCGNDFPYAHIRDILAHSFAAEENLETMASRAVMVFINGDYWGYQNLRERQDQHYTENHFGEDNIDLLEHQRTAIEGDNTHWDAMIDFIAANDISIPTNYEYIQTQMDVENFAIYNCYELFLANTDWPDHNIKRWRPRDDGGRWRWLYFDMDLSLYAGSGIPSYNMIDMATNPDEGAYGNPYWSTVILNKLLKNDEFKELFLNHFCDRLNSRFLPSRMHAVMDSVKAAIIDEVPRHRDHWEIENSWQSRLNPIRMFINERPDFTRANFMEYFDFPDSAELALDISPPEAGRIALTAVVAGSAWSGTYFQGMTVKMRAIPNPGWVFDGWSDASLPSDPLASITLTGDSLIVAEFVAGSTGEALINEINYKSSDEFDPGDWVEIHNPGEAQIDLSNWQFRDDNDTHIYIFPEGTFLPAGAYGVLAKDRAEFISAFSDHEGYLFPGEFGFGLGGNDMARLFNELGELVDLVIYSSDPPWPPEPDGMGPTLELIHPDYDNAQFDSWAASLAEFGTPGAINSVTELVDVGDDIAPLVLNLAHPVPNPFNPSTELRFTLPEHSHAMLSIYSIEGRRVRMLHDGSLDAGEHRFQWEGLDDRGRPVSSGIYFAALRAEEHMLSRKLVLLK